MIPADCTCPDCPETARRTPWEADREVAYVPAGDMSGLCTRLQVPRRSLDFAYQTMPVPRAAPSGEHHVLAVLTADRPRGATLDATLSSLARGGSDGWGPKLILSDGPTAEVMSKWKEDGWRSYALPHPVGSARAFVALLRMALNVDPHLEYLTYVEDDVEVCAGFLDYARTVEVPGDVAFVSWFTYDYDWFFPRRGDGLPGWKWQSPDPPYLACRPARFFILAQTCTIPRRTIDLLLSCPMVAGDRWPSRDGQDLMMAWALGDALYAAHFPVLVQHVGGDNSAVKLAGGRAQEGAERDPQDGARTSPYYVGSDFDSRMLLRGGSQ